MIRNLTMTSALVSALFALSARAPRVSTCYTFSPWNGNRFHYNLLIQ